MRRVLPIFVLLACTEYEITEAEEAEPGMEEEGAPVISVDPLALSFDALEVGAGPSQAQAVTVANIGDEILGLQAIYLADSSAPFTLTDATAGLMDPGDSMSFTVSFEPWQGGEALGEILVDSNDPLTPQVSVSLTGTGLALDPDIAIEPEYHDFGLVDVGESEQLAVTVSNQGEGDLQVDEITYTSLTDELAMDLQEGVNGSLPWTLSPGAQAELIVSYTPSDDQADEGHVEVFSDDPDASSVTATQEGEGKIFEGFSTGWYVYDDGIAYETTSNPSYVVDHHGDEDLYWYEPSGAHGLVDSSDPEGDFAIMRQYVLDHAGNPVVVNGPFNYDASSSISPTSCATSTWSPTRIRRPTRSPRAQWTTASR